MENSANQSVNLLANASTVIAGKWLLVAVVVNSKGATSNTLKIYDNTAGTNNIKLTLDTTASVGTVRYAIPLFDGIHSVMAAGTPGDITLIYRPLI